MWSVSEHLVQLSFMAVIIWGAQAFARRAQEGRVSREARLLRSALNISLSALRKLYEDDLASLSGGERPLISGRNQITLLRTQLGRLTSLEPPEVEAVMAASIAAERSETEMAIAGIRVGGVAFWIPKKNDVMDIVESTLREVCSTLRTAEELLNSNAVPRVERASETPSIREADVDDVRAHAYAGAPDLARAMQHNPPYREKAKVRELSF
jgi:hypothetical protein